MLHLWKAQFKLGFKIKRKIIEQENGLLPSSVATTHKPINDGFISTAGGALPEEGSHGTSPAEACALAHAWP